jgi:hypothetical protein
LPATLRSDKLRDAVVEDIQTSVRNVCAGRAALQKALDSDQDSIKNQFLKHESMKFNPIMFVPMIYLIWRGCFGELWFSTK